MQFRAAPVPPRRRGLYLGGALLCLVALAYAGALSGPFLWDDRPLILSEPAVREPGPLSSYFLSPFWRPQAEAAAPRHMYRPLVTLSYVLDLRLHGENAVGFHLTNLGLHLINSSLLLWLLLRRGATPGAAAACAALWALHPRLTESVSWISGRTDVLAATFSLGALLCWAPEAGPRRRWAAALLLLLGLLSKEVAAAAALAIVAAERRSGRRRLLPLVGAVVAYGSLRVVALRGELPEPEDPLSALQRGATVLEAMGTYTLMILDPWRPETQIGLIGWPRWPLVALGAVLALFSLALAPRLRRLPGDTLAALALGGGALGMVLHAAPLPVDIVAADRFLYVPLLGAALLLGQALASAPLRARPAALLAAALLALSFVPAVRLRNRAWADEVALWVDALERSHPRNGRPALELGNVYYRAGLFEDAMILYRHAAEAARETAVQSGVPASALGNVANCLSQLGRYDEAIGLQRRLLRETPASPKHHHDLGLALLHAGRFQEARAAFRRALELMPSYGAAQAALQVAESAQRDDQDTAGAPLARAQRLDRLGRRPEARAAWLAVARRPGAPPEELHRAAAYLLLYGTEEEATEAVGRLRVRSPEGGARLADLLAERRERERRLVGARAAWAPLLRAPSAPHDHRPAS